MKRSIYKNPRNDHTFQVEQRDGWFCVIEKDWMGEECGFLAKYEARERAQQAIDLLADSMEWRFVGEQKDAV